MSCLFLVLYNLRQVVLISMIPTFFPSIELSVHKKEKELVPLKRRLSGATKQVVKMVEKIISGKKTHSIVI